MRQALKQISIAVGLLFLLLAGSIALDQIPRSKAKHPKSIADVEAFLAWHPEPMGAFKYSSGTKVYCVITGPAGRYLPSGPAGYAFDEGGKFLTWSADIGDFKNPPEIFGDGVKRQRITIKEIKAVIADTNH